MLDLAFALVLALGSAGVGLRVLRRLGLMPEHPADGLSIGLVLGLGLLGLAASGLAMVGRLGRVEVGSLAIGFAACGLGSLRHLDWNIGGRREDYRRIDGIVDLAIITGVLGTMLTAMGPVTDGDALCYHLQVPKIFLRSRGMIFDADLHETAYPLLMEMLYAVALSVRGPTACRLVHWTLGLGFAGCVSAMARPVLGDRSRWAGAVALLSPAVANGMGAPLNDVALAAFAAGCLAVRLGGDLTARRGLLAGLLGGMALGVKYPAIPWVGLVGLSMLVPRPRPRALLAFALTAAVVGLPWYARAYVHTGNPVHPFFRSTFGGSGIDEVLDPIKRPMDPSPANLLTALAPLTLQPDRFDSLSHQLGPAFLLLVPAALLARPPRRVWGLVALGQAFLMACMTRRQSMRFLLSAVGPLSVAAAWGVVEFRRKGSTPGHILAGLLAVTLVAEGALCVARARHGVGVVLGLESAESYLARREPTYTIGRWMTAHLPGGARVVGQDHRGFYLPVDYAMELAHRRRTGLGSRGESADEVVDRLRERKFTHLMLCPPIRGEVEFDPTLSDRLRPWLDGRAPLYRADLGDADGVVRRYAIYDLGGVRR